LSAATNVALLDNVRKVYSGRAVVDGISLTLHPGKTYFLVGPNGCGKTTTLETLVGLRPATSGVVQLLGVDPRQDTSMRARIRVCLQGGALHPQVTVAEHFQFLEALFNAPRGSVREVAAKFEITDLLKRRYGKLSGGQQRRVQVASCLFGESDLIVLDEPTSGVDLESRLSVWASMRHAMAHSSTAVLATTHDLNEAEDYADEVFVMRAGRLVSMGTPQQIVADSGLVAVLQFAADAFHGLTEAVASESRAVLTRDRGTATVAYRERAALARDADYLRAHDIVVHQRSPRLSDAYLLTYGSIGHGR
jgi:ABC-2 type transport system ATP-binding protein